VNKFLFSITAIAACCGIGLLVYQGANDDIKSPTETVTATSGTDSSSGCSCCAGKKAPSEVTATTGCCSDKTEAVSTEAGGCSGSCAAGGACCQDKTEGATSEVSTTTGEKSGCCASGSCCTDKPATEETVSTEASADTEKATGDSDSN
jgi:hypothetical protein